MKKVFPRLSIFAAITVVALLTLCAGSLAEDVIEAAIEMRPGTPTGADTVEITISITNTGSDPTPLPVVLYDPANNACTGFGSGGTAHLAAGESASYTARWTVTADQLERGRITYVARYTTTTASGELVAVSKPFAAAIEHNEAAASFDDIGPSMPGGGAQGQPAGTPGTGSIDMLDIAIMFLLCVWVLRFS